MIYRCTRCRKRYTIAYAKCPSCGKDELVEEGNSRKFGIGFAIPIVILVMAVGVGAAVLKIYNAGEYEITSEAKQLTSETLQSTKLIDNVTQLISNDKSIEEITNSIDEISNFDKIPGFNEYTKGLNSLAPSYTSESTIDNNIKNLVECDKLSYEEMLDRLIAKGMTEGDAKSAIQRSDIDWVYQAYNAISEYKKQDITKKYTDSEITKILSDERGFTSQQAEAGMRLYYKIKKLANSYQFDYGDLTVIAASVFTEYKDIKSDSKSLSCTLRCNVKDTGSKRMCIHFFDDEKTLLGTEDIRIDFKNNGYHKVTLELNGDSIWHGGSGKSEWNIVEDVKYFVLSENRSKYDKNLLEAIE